MAGRKLNAAIYARVSTKKEQQQSSIPSQLHMCEERCRQLGYTVAEQWIHSDDETGRNMDRPGWQAVMRLMEARVIQAVVVKDRSRISRNQRDYWRLKEEYLQRFGVQIVPLSGIQVDPDNIWTEFAEEDEIREAERFSRILSDKTRRGRQARLAQGYFCNTPPYGTMAGSEKGVPVKDPDSWPVLERVFSMAAQGEPVGEIRAWLTSQGIPAKRGGGWSFSSVADMLANPFYRGLYIDPAGREWPLRHVCLVEESQWWAAQRERSCRRGRRRGEGQFLHLLPKVVCSHLQVVRPSARRGEPLLLRPKWSRGRGGVLHAHYYRTDRERASGGVTSEPVDALGAQLRSAVNAPVLDELVLGGLLEALADERQLEVDLRGALEAEAGGLEARLAAMRREYAGQKRELTRLDIAIVEAALSSDGGVAAALRPLGLRRDELEQSLSGLRGEIARLEQLQSAGDPRPVLERVNVLRYVAEHGTRQDIAAVLEQLVDHVDVRLDRVQVALRVVSQIQRSAPQPAVIVYPLDNVPVAMLRKRSG